MSYHTMPYLFASQERRPPPWRGVPDPVEEGAHSGVDLGAKGGGADRGRGKVLGAGRRRKT